MIEKTLEKQKPPVINADSKATPNQKLLTL